MEGLAQIVTLGLLLLIVIWINTKNNSKPSRGVTIVGHGHRCFAEGLNPSEGKIVELLTSGLSHQEYFIFNNLIIPSTNGQSTEIDHIVISKFGIFVIETKENNGWVYTHKNWEKWPVTYQNTKKYHLPNPIWQNYGHIMALKKFMPFIEDNFINIIVFTGNVDLKNERIPNVLYDHELIAILKKYNRTVISPQRLFMAIGKLSYLCQAADITAVQHVANLKQFLESREKD